MDGQPTHASTEQFEGQPLLIAGNGNRALAENVSKALGMPLGDVKLGSFSNT
eukprot:gene3797-4193_t